MIYKLSKSKVVVATLLLLTATMMNNAVLAGGDPDLKEVIHNTVSPLLMLGGGATMCYAWINGTQRLAYAAILSTGVVFNYVTISEDFSSATYPDIYKKYCASVEPAIFVLSALCVGIYLLKLLADVLGKEAYFGLDQHFNRPKQYLNIENKDLLALIFLSGAIYFAMHFGVASYLNSNDD